MSKKMLLTGQPGTGKTTLFQKFIDTHNEHCIGFYAQEVLHNGERVGFEVVPVNLPIEKGLIAHINFDTPKAVSKYKVDTSHLDKLVALTEEYMSEDTILTIDEIGPMQAYSEKFKALIDNALGSTHNVLATIKQDSTPWTDAVKNKFDLPTTIVTRDNRDDLPYALTRFFF